MLVKMAKKKNRRQTESCVMTHKDLFLDDILTDKKLSTFYSAMTKIKSQNNNEIPQMSDDQLMEIYIEDFIHKISVRNKQEDTTLNSSLQYSRFEITKELVRILKSI